MQNHHVDHLKFHVDEQSRRVNSKKNAHFRCYHRELSTTLDSIWQLMITKNPIQWHTLSKWAALFLRAISGVLFKWHNKIYLYGFVININKFGHIVNIICVGDRFHWVENSLLVMVRIPIGNSLRQKKKSLFFFVFDLVLIRIVEPIFFVHSRWGSLSKFQNKKKIKAKIKKFIMNKKCKKKIMR